jgi:hypothetical protein
MPVLVGVLLDIKVEVLAGVVVATSGTTVRVFLVVAKAVRVVEVVVVVVDAVDARGSRDRTILRASSILKGLPVSGHSDSLPAT